jgi:Mg/Co/Ni transporter MgtE
MDIEAKNGNTQAANFNKEVLNDPNELAKLFELTNENNRFAILQNLNQEELQELLPNLEKEDLQLGLNYFTKDKLLDLLGSLPSQDLVKMTNQVFSEDQILQRIPTEEIDKVLTSPDIDNDLLLKNMETLKPQVLVRMYEAATGKEAPVEKSVGSMSGEETIYTSSKDITKMIGALPDREYKNAIKSMSSYAKRDMVMMMAAKDDKIMSMFPSKVYTSMLDEKQKPEIIKTASVLSQDQLMKLDKNLNQILLANLVTLINPDKFANILTSKYQDVLKKIVAA